MAKEAVKDSSIYVPVNKVHPNAWNDNEVDADTLVKIERGMRRLLSRAKVLPPIIVRPHPSIAGEYQIIDGEHRWKLTKDKLRLNEIYVTVLPVDDATARILTETLNNLRGSPNEDKKAELVAEIVKHGERLDTLHDFLPDTAEEIAQLLDRRGLDMELMKAIADTEAALEEDAEERQTPSGDNTFVEQKFLVSVDAGIIVEQEIERLSKLLEGKNKRGRALEIMAVTSALSHEEDIKRMLVERASRSSGGMPWDIGTARMTPRVKS